ncbi:MAG: hypothetical protein HY000_24770 [Planctomycetes bacterium]|nr:hypothetical protein [Planctomycetota bacterium]
MGIVAANRLVRELESLEASLQVAERSASASRSSSVRNEWQTHSDLTSRLAELERRELELDARERAIERHRIHLHHVQERLARGKDSLKRAIAKFRVEVSQRSEEIDARTRVVECARSELVEARRELAREQMRFKVVARDSAKAEPSSDLSRSDLPSDPDQAQQFDRPPV